MTEPLKDVALIVLYKSKIMDSSTVTSLLKADKTGVKLTIIIWNNGPNLLEQDDVLKFEEECNKKGISFEIYQDVRNISLSHLYNFCINKYKKTDYFTILDQDSILLEDFLTNLVAYSSFDLICPQVFDEKNVYIQYYPFIHPYPKKLVFEGKFDAKKVSTIGSGLSLSEKLLFKIIQYYGYVFDEDFAFYFADSDLFYRFEKLDLVSGYCCGKIFHSESNRLGYSKMSESTRLEMGYFNVIRRIKKRRNIFRILFFCLRYKIRSKSSFSTLFKLIKCAAITKRHPRSIFEIHPNFKPTHSNFKSQ